LPLGGLLERSWGRPGPKKNGPGGARSALKKISREVSAKIKSLESLLSALEEISRQVSEKAGVRFP